MAVEDRVAMVSRNTDGSDAQPNKTVRILSDEDSRKADETQLSQVDAKPDPRAAFEDTAPRNKRGTKTK